MFLVILTFIFRKHLKADLKHYIFALTIAFVLLLPFFYTSIKEPVLMNARTERISTFAKGINKDTASIFINNYFSHFTLDFLFLKGDPNLRQGTGKNGVLYLTMLPFLILGIYYSIKNIKRPVCQLLLIWLLIFPLGGSLTNDGVPHATRTLIGAPLFSIVAATGLNFLIEFIEKIKRRLTRTIILTLLLSSVLVAISIEISHFYKIYFTEYPVYSISWWEYGEKEIFTFIKQYGKDGGVICMENLNYWNEETLTKFYLPDTKLNIISGNDNTLCKDKGSINVVSSAKALPRSGRLLYQVKDLNGNPYWSIYTR